MRACFQRAAAAKRATRAWNLNIAHSNYGNSRTREHNWHINVSARTHTILLLCCGFVCIGLCCGFLACTRCEIRSIIALTQCAHPHTHTHKPKHCAPQTASEQHIRRIAIGTLLQRFCVLYVAICLYRVFASIVL